ncbi:hypothetical protein MPK71_gp285 [Erwinia phage pEa_SNUABM_1]|uniref:Uncharacterized protein n=1 Tax=Erwinia phage pEa_SNUABM_1 TaxID=2869543 RepID=A0AAE7XJD0_9CAUD|nr:hypothetical protein MPK71_gp285 [Erwinia phage pEa_SNUABM_1]QZE57494.1 hypothetical protein pEaSNUABM1_00285 [Erwinia phage pEa_SNUABM_1]
MRLTKLPRYLYLTGKQVKNFFKLLKANRELAAMEHEAEVLKALHDLTERDMKNGTMICIKVLSFFHELKKPRGVRHNLPYLWPKRDLIRLLNQNGVAVGPVPNYFVALHQLVDKRFK